MTGHLDNPEVKTQNVNVIYVVVYGESHEDFLIYSDLEKARHKLQVQQKCCDGFKPYMATYVLNDSGTYAYLDPDGANLGGGICL
jgi:hypothetical protein